MQHNKTRQLRSNISTVEGMVKGEQEEKPHLELVRDEDNRLLGEEALDAVREHVLCCVVVHRPARPCVV